MRGSLLAYRNVIIAFAFVTLPGCPAGGGGGGNDFVNFDASLNGAQEVPPVDTAATGSGNFTLDADAGIMVYSVSFSGLSGPVTSAHFHAGAVGVSGGIIVDLSDEFVGDDDGFVQGAAAFSDSEIAQLQAGNVYINLHTEANPDGEIRGQLIGE